MLMLKALAVALAGGAVLTLILVSVAAACITGFRKMTGRDGRDADKVS
jgi:hypothetical protein